MALVKQMAWLLAGSGCCLPSPGTYQQPPYLPRRDAQWEQQRLSFPGPQDSGSEQSSRSQWGTPAWCRTDQILRVPTGTETQQSSAPSGKPSPRSLPSLERSPILGQAPNTHLTQSTLPTHPTSAGDTAHLPKGRHRGVPALALWEPLPCKTAAPGPIGLHGVPQLGVGS